LGCGDDPQDHEHAKKQTPFQTKKREIEQDPQYQDSAIGLTRQSAVTRARREGSTAPLDGAELRSNGDRLWEIYKYQEPALPTRNPNQLNASAIDPKTGAAWVSLPVPASGAIGNIPNGPQLMFAGPSTPQPGTFDATPPQANPVIFNKQAAPLSSGGIAIPNSSTTVKNPA
jgi:hypothetical protein